MTNRILKQLKYFPFATIAFAILGIAILNPLRQIVTDPTGTTILQYIYYALILFIIAPLILLILAAITGVTNLTYQKLVVNTLRTLKNFHTFITTPSRLRINRLRLATGNAPPVPTHLINKVASESRVNREPARPNLSRQPSSQPKAPPAEEARGDDNSKTDELGPPIEAVEPPSPEEAARAWDELILPEGVKREFKVTQQILENPAEYRKVWGDRVDTPKGMILTGPPGTGKTTIAKALAGSAGYSFYTISPADAKSMWHGQGEKKVKQIYETARANAPAIVFWDEMDAVASKRTDGPGSSQAHNSLVNQILQEIDGFQTSDQVVFTAAATNRPDMLDDAIRSRLNYQIEIPLPIPEAREAMIKLYMGHFLDRIQAPLEELVERTEGMSGRDIKNLAQAIAFAATANDTLIVTETELATAFERVKTNDADQKSYLS